MKQSILIKLETLVERYEKVQHLLGDPDVLADQNRFRALSKEYSQLEEVTKCFQAYQQAKEDLVAAEEMAQEDDAEMREMAQEEIKEAKAEIERLADELQVLLLPKGQTMIATVSWKFVPVLAVMKLIFSLVIYSVCTASTQSVVAGV